MHPTRQSPTGTRPWASAQGCRRQDRFGPGAVPERPRGGLVNAMFRVG